MIFILIIFAVFLIIAFFTINSENHTKPNPLIELLNSSEYQQSEFQIHKIKESYVLQYKNTNQFVDLIFPSWSWPGNKLPKQCLGTPEQILKAFHFHIHIDISELPKVSY